MCQVPKNIECELHTRSHEFFKLDYEKSLDIIKQLHNQKLNYQKFYVSLAASIVTISIFLFHLKPSDVGKNLNLSTGSLVGALFILAGLIGYIVIKNLTSIRCNEVFFNNLIIDLRRIYIKGLNLKGYANLKFAYADDRSSADYISIVVCSIINFFMLLIGCFLVFPNGNSIQLTFSVGLIAILYVIMHIFSIEHSLRSGVHPEIDPSSIPEGTGDTQ